MLEPTQYHFQELPPDKQESALLIPFRYFPDVTPLWSLYEREVLQGFPEAMEDFLTKARLLSLFPGELSVSRGVDGWKAVCIAPVTVLQGRVESKHFYGPYCAMAMTSFHLLLENGFDRTPPAYIAVPEDQLGLTGVVRAARMEFETARGVYVGLLKRPRHIGERHAFRHPIEVSALLAGSRDQDPELGIGPLYPR